MMATKVLEEDLICQVCHDVLMSDPYTLRCLHNYCGQCVQRMERHKDQGGLGVYCPVCRQFCSEADIQFNYLIKSIIDRFSNISAGTLSDQGLVPEGPLCGQCMKSSPAAFCVNCNYNLCDVCQYTHLEIKELREHRIVSVGGSNGPDSPVIKLCPDHPGCAIKASCKPCCRAVCSECVLGKHNTHETEGIQQALQNLLPEVRNSLTKLDSECQFVKRVRSSVDKVNEDVTENLRQVLRHAQEEMERKLQQIKADFEKINHHVFTQVQLKNGIIIKQDLDDLVSRMESLLSWGDNVVQMSCGAAQLYELQNDLVIRMQDLIHQEMDIKNAVDYMHTQCTPQVFTATHLPEVNLVGQVVRLSELSRDSEELAKLGNVTPGRMIHHLDPDGATGMSQFFVDLPEISEKVPKQENTPPVVKDNIGKQDKMEDLLKEKKLAEFQRLNPDIKAQIVGLLKAVSEGNLTQTVIRKRTNSKNNVTGNQELAEGSGYSSVNCNYEEINDESVKEGEILCTSKSRVNSHYAEIDNESMNDCNTEKRSVLVNEDSCENIRQYELNTINNQSANSNMTLSKGENSSNTEHSAQGDNNVFLQKPNDVLIKDANHVIIQESNNVILQESGNGDSPNSKKSFAHGDNTNVILQETNKVIIQESNNESRISLNNVKSFRFSDTLNLESLVNCNLSKVESIDTKRKISRFCPFDGALWCTFTDYEYINVYSMDGELIRTLSKSKLYPKALHPIDDETIMAACQEGLFIIDGKDGQIVTRIKQGSFTDLHASGNFLAVLSEDKMFDGHQTEVCSNLQLYGKCNNVHIHFTTPPYKQFRKFALGHRHALSIIVHDRFLYVSSGHPYHNIVKYNLQGEMLARFGRDGTNYLYFPYLCMVDGNGALLVGNGVKNKLYVVVGGRLRLVEGVQSVWPKDAVIIGNYLFVKSDKNIHKYQITQ